MEDRIEALAAEAGVEDFNPRSTPQVIAALKARRGPQLHEPEGRQAVSRQGEPEAVDDELAAAILEFRSEFKVLSNYVRPYIHRHYSTQLRALEGGVRCAGRPYSPPTGRSERALAG